MAYRLSTPAEGAATIVLAAGFVAGGVSAANSAAPTPRVSDAQCSSVANNNGGTGYVVVDTQNNTSCVVKANGTFVWSNAASSCRNEPVRFRGSLLVTQNRGDVAFKMKVRYIRGNKVIKKTIKVYPGRKFNTTFKFPKKGKWTAVFSYRGKTVTTRVNVTSCAAA